MKAVALPYDEVDPGRQALGRGRLLVQRAVHLPDEGADIADHGQVDPPVPADLLRLDIDLNEIGLGFHQRAEVFHQDDAVSENDDQDRTRGRLRGRAVAAGVRMAEAQRMVVGDDCRGSMLMV